MSGKGEFLEMPFIVNYKNNRHRFLRGDFELCDYLPALKAFLRKLYIKGLIQLAS